MFTVEPAPKDAKQKYVELTGPELQAALACTDMRRPILADGPDGKVFAELDSLRKFRGEEFEIDV